MPIYFYTIHSNILCHILVSDEHIGRDTIQSSTEWGGTSDKAVDGNLDGHMMFTKSCSHTKKEKNPWWAIDMGPKDILLDAIVLSRRTDCCGD